MSVGDKLDSELEARIKELGTLAERIAVVDKNPALLMHSVNKDPLPSSEF